MPITEPYAVSTAQVLESFAEVHIQQNEAIYNLDALAPIITTDRESVVVRGLDRGDLARLEMTRRMSGARADRAGYGTTTATITVDPWALAKPTGLREIANQDAVYDIEAADTAYLMEQWLLRRSVQAAAAMWATGIWTTDVTPGTLWSAAAGDPIVDVETGKVSIKRDGMVNAPDDWFHLFVGANVWRHLKNRLELRTNQERGINLTQLQAAQILNVGSVRVMDAVRNTAVEGAADVGAFIYDPEDALLLCIQPQPESIGRMPARIGGAFTFAWQRPGFTPQGYRLKSWIDEDEDAHVTECHAEFIVAVRNADLGYFFNEVVS